MILYFSGTGNSEYVAKRIGKEIQDETLNVFEKIREQDTSKMFSKKPWIIVTPTYAWRIPRILQTWIENTKFDGSQDIYFVMTCGKNIGNAGKYTKILSLKKGMHDKGCYAVLMPENYIALFTTPSKQEAIRIIEQTEDSILEISQLIQRNEAYSKSEISFIDKLSSGVVNDLYYPVFVHARKFQVSDACIHCGKCVQVCPLKNIKLEQGIPVWDDHCTHCMACICRCPKEAIEYGKHSVGLYRYVCPKEA